MKIIIYISGLVLLSATSTYAQDADKCQAERDALDALNAHYDEVYQSIHYDDQPNSVRIAGNVTINRREFSFNMPETTATDRRMSFNSPKVSMRNHTYSFDKPVVTMVLKQTGSRPVITCRHVVQCTTKMKPMYTKIPETTMERHTMSFKTPEVVWDTTHISFKVPEFTMKRRTLSLDLPEFAGGPTDSGAETQREFDLVQAKHKKEAAPLITALFACQQGSLVDMRAETVKQFDAAIAELDTSIVQITTAGGNPTAVASDEGPLDLIAMREEVKKQKEEALALVDDAIVQTTAAEASTYEAFDIKEDSDTAPTGSPA